MTQKNNFHTHTKRCGHAEGSEEDYVKSALACGMSQLGFSDHGPFPDVDFGKRMLFGELGDYLETIEGLREEYGSELVRGKGLVIWKGLEIEYLPRYRDYYEELLTKRGVDYLLLGEHFYMGAGGECVFMHDQPPSTEQYLCYARAVAEGVRTGLFQAVAHPDMYMRHPFPWDDNCARAADMIIDAAAAVGAVLEYNVSWLRRGRKPFPDGMRYPYPCDAFWQAAAKASVKVMVGSDCHDPACLWDGAVEEAYGNLRELGVEPVTELMGAV